MSPRIVHNQPYCFCWLCWLDMPSLSGVSDMDYPLQGPGLLSLPNLPELSAVRRVPLPPELVEQFSRIFLVIQEKLFQCFQFWPWEFIQTNSTKYENALLLLPRKSEFQLNRFIDMQCNCMMGVFPEICRAWLTIDNDIFMWNYEDGWV